MVLMKGNPMKSRIAACAIATVSLIGLTACSSGSESANPTPTATAAPTLEETTPPAPEPTTPAATSDSAEQSVEAACLDMAGPMAEASGKMYELSEEPTDAQNAVDSWTALTDAFGDISNDVTNPEMKAASTAVYNDLSALRDAMQKVYVEEDMTAMGDYMTATQNWSTSYSALMDLCTPMVN